MSNESNKLLEILHDEYNNQINKGISKTKAKMFYCDDIAKKYNYDTNSLKKLFGELLEYNYVKKWVVGVFILNVD